MGLDKKLVEARIVGGLTRMGSRLGLPGKRPQRPDRSMRLLALALVLFTLYGLPDAEGWHDDLWAVWSVVFFSLLAIAPRGLYDGRFELWSRRHDALSLALVVVFAFVPGFLLLSEHFSDRTSLLIAVLMAPGPAALAFYSGRRHRRRSVHEGSSSAVNDEPPRGRDR